MPTTAPVCLAGYAPAGFVDCPPYLRAAVRSFYEGRRTTAPPAYVQHHAAAARAALASLAEKYNLTVDLQSVHLAINPRRRGLYLLRANATTRSGAPLALQWCTVGYFVRVTPDGRPAGLFPIHVQ